MGSKGIIVKVKRNPEGEITHVMLNTGEVYTIDEAISLSQKGFIENIIVKEGQNGKEYYRDHPTSLGDLNFDFIPEFD